MRTSFATTLLACLALVAPLSLFGGCASDKAARERPPHVEKASPESEEYEALIAAAIDMARDIRERWQRGEPRDVERETRTLELFLRASELRPDRVEGPYGAAVMLVAACQANRKACAELCPPAFALLDRADAIEAGYRYSTWNRGVCLEGTGRYREALLAAEQSLDEHPDDPDMWALRAKVRLSLGYLDGACEDLARMFDLMGLTGELNERLAPYGCGFVNGEPRFVPEEDAPIQL